MRWSNRRDETERNAPVYAGGETGRNAVHRESGSGFGQDGAVVGSSRGIVQD